MSKYKSGDTIIVDLGEGQGTELLEVIKEWDDAEPSDAWVDIFYQLKSLEKGHNYNIATSWIDSYAEYIELDQDWTEVLFQ